MKSINANDLEDYIDPVEQADDPFVKPIEYDEAIEFGRIMLKDFTGESKDDVCIVVFKFDSGYQVDVISEEYPEFEILDYLYDENDVVTVLKWDGENTIQELEIKEIDN